MATPHSWKEAELCFQTKLPITYTPFTLGHSYMMTLTEPYKGQEWQLFSSQLIIWKSDYVKGASFSAIALVKMTITVRKKFLILKKASISLKIRTGQQRRAIQLVTHEKAENVFSFLKYGFNCVAKPTSNQYGINWHGRVWKEVEVCTYIYPS